MGLNKGHGGDLHTDAGYMTCRTRRVERIDPHLLAMARGEEPVPPSRRPTYTPPAATAAPMQAMQVESKSPAPRYATRAIRIPLPSEIVAANARLRRP